MKGKRTRRRRKIPLQLVKGVPGDDCDSCVDWLLKNINRAEGRGARVGNRPEPTQTAPRVAVIADHSFSSCSTSCPCAMWRDAITRVTASISSRPKKGRECG